MKAVPQGLRNRIVRAGHATEPPEHVRPAKGPCPYVDTRLPDGSEVPSCFVFEGAAYEIKYVSGSFFPFIFRQKNENR
jgi:hypothetical protein